MRVLVRYGLALLLIAGIQGSAGQAVADINPARESNLSSQQSANQGRGPCDDERFIRITPKEAHAHPFLVDALIRCVSGWRTVPGGYAAFECIGDLESSDWPWARGGPNLGIMQISGWTARAQTYLRRRWFNDSQATRVFGSERGAFIARANVLAAGVWASRTGWSAWSTHSRCGV